MIVRHLQERIGMTKIYAAGVSLGANILLKFLGEQGPKASSYLRGTAVLSPPIDLRLCALKMLEPQNWFYQRYFVRRLKERIRRKAALFPKIADLNKLERVRTIYEFDDLVTAPHFGFGTAENYYRIASSAPLLKDIRVPTLLIQSKDDPMIPFQTFRDAGIEENPFLRLIATEYGGHTGFLGAPPDNRNRPGRLLGRMPGSANSCLRWSVTEGRIVRNSLFRRNPPRPVAVLLHAGQVRPAPPVEVRADEAHGRRLELAACLLPVPRRPAGPVR